MAKESRGEREGGGRPARDSERAADRVELDAELATWQEASKAMHSVKQAMHTADQAMAAANAAMADPAAASPPAAPEGAPPSASAETEVYTFDAAAYDIIETDPQP